MGFFRTTPKQTQKKTIQKKIHFADVKNPQRHEYAFDWDLENDVWYSRAELKAFNETRWNEADVLRKQRGISTSSRDDADKIEAGRELDIFIGDKITNALDDRDEGEISVRGIEHFVWPVLQKEMIRRKKALKKVVIEQSHNKTLRKKDPQGLLLAEEVAFHSQWARDVATERGIKYCSMKRGGGLLKNTKLQRAKRGFDVSKRSMAKTMTSIRALKMSDE
jgi:hypothetical protein